MSFLIFPSYEIISSVDAWANMKANANAIWRDLINNGPRDSFRRRASCDFQALSSMLNRECWEEFPSKSSLIALTEL